MFYALSTCVSTARKSAASGWRRYSSMIVTVALIVAANPTAAVAWSYDPGGNVLDYYEEVRQANYFNQAIVIDGVCSSACTMKLAARRVCVTPEARLRFHSASADGFNSMAGNILLMSVYPRPIRRWVALRGALRTQDFTEMSGREAIALGIRACA